MSYLNTKAVRLGYVPLTDCAPLAIAKEKGLFEKYNVKVKLVREPGWASLRDKLVYNELDIASSVSALALAIQLGKGCVATDVKVPMMISMGGNSIALSKELDPEVIGNGEGLRDFMVYKWKKSRPLTFAVVHNFSSHHLLLREWLIANSIDPDENVEIITLPPEVIPRNLEAGTIDGYCVGEPWASKAVLEDFGWIVKTSMGETAPAAEKLIVSPSRFVESNREVIVAICKALYEACAYCQNQSNSEEISKLLSSDRYLNIDASIIQNSFAKEYKWGVKSVVGGTLHEFHTDRLHQPNSEKFRYILNKLVQHGVLPKTSFDEVEGVGAEDIYEEVIA